MHTRQQKMYAIGAIYAVLLLSAFIGFVWESKVSSVAVLTLLYLAGFFLMQKICEFCVPRRTEASAGTFVSILLMSVATLAMVAAGLLYFTSVRIDGTSFALATALHCLESFILTRRSGSAFASQG